MATTVLPYGSVDVVALIGLYRNTVPSVNMAAVQDLLYDHPDLSCTEIDRVWWEPRRGQVLGQR